MYFSIWIKRRNPNPRQRIHRSPNHLGHNHPTRVIEVDGVVIHVPIEIDPGFEAQRIFGQEPSHLRVVVARPIVVEARARILLPAGVAQAIAAFAGARRDIPEGAVGDGFEDASLVGGEARHALVVVVMKAEIHAGLFVSGVRIFISVDNLIDHDPAQVFGLDAILIVVDRLQVLSLQEVMVDALRSTLSNAVVVGVVGVIGMDLPLSRNVLGEPPDTPLGVVLVGLQQSARAIAFFHAAAIVVVLVAGDDGPGLAPRTHLP